MAVDLYRFYDRFFFSGSLDLPIAAHNAVLFLSLSLSHSGQQPTRFSTRACWYLTCGFTAMCALQLLYKLWIYNAYFQTPGKMYSPPLQRFMNESSNEHYDLHSLVHTLAFEFFLLPPFLNDHYFFHWSVMICRQMRTTLLFFQPISRTFPLL